MTKRIFFTTFLIANLAIVGYGVLAVFTPNILFEPFSRHVYQFPPEAGAAVTYLNALFRLLGYFNILYGALCLYLLFRCRQSQKPGLVIIASLLAYIGPITFDNTVGSIGFFEVVEHLLFAAMVLAGGACSLKNEVMLFMGWEPHRPEG